MPGTRTTVRRASARFNSRYPVSDRQIDGDHSIVREAGVEICGFCCEARRTARTHRGRSLRVHTWRQRHAAFTAAVDPDQLDAQSVGHQLRFLVRLLEAPREALRFCGLLAVVFPLD